MYLWLSMFSASCCSCCAITRIWFITAICEKYAGTCVNIIEYAKMHALVSLVRALGCSSVCSVHVAIMFGNRASWP